MTCNALWYIKWYRESGTEDFNLYIYIYICCDLVEKLKGKLMFN